MWKLPLLNPFPTQGDDFEFPPDLMALLYSYDWPGNIRQLEALIKRYSISRDPYVIESYLQENLSQGKTQKDGSLAASEKDVILSALIKNFWNRGQAAKILGLSYNTVRRRIEKYRLNLAHPS